MKPRNGTSHPDTITLRCEAARRVSGLKLNTLGAEPVWLGRSLKGCRTGR